MTNEKTESGYIWPYLISIGKLELIELMAKSDRKEIKEINIKRALVPDLVVHNTIIRYLENNGVKVNRQDIKR